MAMAHPQEEPAKTGEATLYVRVSDSVYGPYSVHAIHAFVHEGRIGARSLVAATPEGPFEPLRSHAEFSDLFPHLTRQPLAADDHQTPRLAPHHATVKDKTLNNVVIFIDLQTTSANDLQQRFRALGRAVHLFGSVFILRTALSAAQLRHSISQILGSRDCFFLVDATNERLAWFNLGPEVDAHIRLVWSQPVE